MLTAGLSSVLAGAGLLALSPRPGTDAGAVPNAAATALRPVTPSVSPPAAVPQRLLIPALHIDAPIIPAVADQHGALAVPADPHQVGWWKWGSTPGAPVGTVVLAGHVDTARVGPGALFALRRVDLNARIYLQASPGWYAYRVVARRSYPKAGLPTDVFDQTLAPRLTLITCGGRFHNGHYDQNLVVYAIPATPPGPSHTMN